MDLDTLFTKAAGTIRQARENADPLNIRPVPVLSRLEIRKIAL